MFEAQTYLRRRNCLRQEVNSGLLLFLGNRESPMNYGGNPYPFRQDSSFLYYWGLDYPDLAAVIDADEGIEVIYGNDPTVGEIVWTGTQPTIQDKSQKAGVARAAPLGELEPALQRATRQGRQVHFLPPYRADNLTVMERLLGIHHTRVADQASPSMIRQVISQRSRKTAEEIGQIETTLDVTHDMHIAALQLTRPELYEREVAGAVEGIALSQGVRCAYPVIFSVHGETLHNHGHENLMRTGDLVVHDSGAESALHYASDITRTFPVSGQFTSKQEEIYQIVLEAEETVIRAVKPGVKFKDLHLLACRILVARLRELGLMKGDPEEVVRRGAHALFFPCGVGHMLGLDVHDMEDLGEERVGYDQNTQRDSQFGLCYLRLAKALEPGYVVTIEPGIYFIPELIDSWRADNTFSAFINYEKVELYRNFGGVRVEDNVLVSDESYRLLGKRIPKTVDEIEAASQR